MSKRRQTLSYNARPRGQHGHRARPAAKRSAIFPTDRLKTAWQSGPVRTLSENERLRYEQELLKRDAPPTPEEE